MADKTQSYRWNATDYAKNSSNQYEWAKELIPKLNLSQDEALIDIGCGDGKVTAMLSTKLPSGQVVGIDNSKEMITLARKSFPRTEFPNLSFLRMDARELKFHGRFDIVFSNAALHWVKDHHPVLAGVQKSLKSPGRLLFQMAGKGNAQDVLAIVCETIKEDRWLPYFKGFSFPYGFYGPEEYHPWLAEAGLKPERVMLLPKDMKFQGREGLLGWIRTTWLPYTNRVPDDLRDLFTKEIANKYLDAYSPDSNATVHVRMVRLEVQATKV